MDNSEVVGILNGLVQICLDGQHGFAAAAAAVSGEHIRTLFQRLSRQREEMVRQLQAEVRRLGGDPGTAGSVSASLHRGWINVKSHVPGGDDMAIVAEAERGEDAAKTAYEEALKVPLPAGARSLIVQQSAIVRDTYDQVQALAQAKP